MQTLQLVREQKLEDLLDPLIRKQAQVTVTHQTPRGWRMFRSHLSSRCRSSRTMILKPCVIEESETGPHPTAGALLTITFRHGHKKCAFTSAVVMAGRDGTSDTLSIRWPDSVGQLQRRLCERVRPPAHQVIPVRVWLESGSSDARDGVRIVRNGQVEDLSVGGIRVKVPLADEFELGATYCCAFTPQRGDPAIVVHSFLRHREASDQGRACLGFQFVGLDSSNAGRHTLDILAHTVQRFQRSRSRSRE